MAGNDNSGRKPKTQLRAATEQIITETSPMAMAYLRDVANGAIPDKKEVLFTKSGAIIERYVSAVDPIRVDVCKYIINQDIGAPRQRTELTGNVNLSWTELMRLSVTSADIEQLPADKPAEIEQISSQD